MDKTDYEQIALSDIITARTMIMLAIFVEIIIQSFALIITPTDWWTWQLLGFITATNLAAVMMAIFAQKSADNIGKAYRKVFTADFYYTVQVLTDFRKVIEAEAEKEGRTLYEEWGDIAPKIYGLGRKYLDARYAQDFVMPPDLEDLGINLVDIADINDDELFS
tara:strand:+ start:985 stop:1476 length:492 start_codon:yes stop_codon:yes gene_type:complete